MSRIECCLNLSPLGIAVSRNITSVPEISAVNVFCRVMQEKRVMQKATTGWLSTMVKYFYIICISFA